MEPDGQNELPQCIRICLNSFSRLIETDESESKSSLQKRRKTNASYAVGHLYLQIVVKEHIYIFNNEPEELQESLVERLSRLVQATYQINKRLLCQLIYKAHFFGNRELFLGLVEEIRGFIVQLKYQGMFDNPKWSQAGVAQQAPILTHPDKIQLEDECDSTVQLSTHQGLTPIKQQAFLKRLKGFCTSFPNVSNDVKTYLDSVISIRAQMTELCHQIGISQPYFSKTSQGSMFRVICKLNCTGKYTAFKQVIYEEEAVDKSSKKGACLAAHKVLLKLYRDYPEVWSELKKIKQKKGIVT